MVHIAWDWNGTLLDDADAVIAATIAVFAENALPQVTAESYRQHFTRPIQSFYARLIGRVVEPDEWLRLDEAFHRHYHRLVGACRLSDGAAAALVEVDRRGWTQSVCSLFPHDELLAALTAHRLLERFRRVDGLRGERGGTKAEHLREHLEAMAVAPADAVLVGDTVDDAVAAGITGAGCVLLDTGNGLHHAGALEQTGVPVVSRIIDALDVVRVGGR